MAYEDDDDLFDEEFDFGDEDEAADADSDVDAEDDPPPAKPRRRTAGKDKPSAGGAKGRPSNRSTPAGGVRRNSRNSERPRGDEEPVPESASEPLPYDDEPIDADALPGELTPEPAGPPADHVVHIYEFGKLKRTIPRKFTDEEAVSFAEEYTRTSKAYGRYAVATPDDEEPSQTFAGASRG
jgi:hypothetical protein